MPTPLPVLQTIAVVGLGYVGLPIALALHAAGYELIGIDASKRRLRDIRTRAADLPPRDERRLELALDAYDFELTQEPEEIERADAVLICVPTPIDARRRPGRIALRSACREVVAYARADQLIVLTSTTWVGSTRELLIDPLRDRGFEPGRDIHVAFAPERIDPGHADHAPEDVPRVLGAETARCAELAKALLEPTAAQIHVVSSPEVAELTGPS